MAHMNGLEFDSLVEIKPNDWESLLQLYEQKRKEATGYSLVKNYMQWLAKEPDLNIKCLSLDENWRTDGTFLMITCSGIHYYVYFNTLDDDLTRLTQALLCLTTAGRDYRLHDFGERLLPAVEVYLERLHLPREQVQMTALYWAPKETVLKFDIDIPAGVRLSSLSLRDVDTVNKYWKYSSATSIEYVKRLISYNLSAGAYDSQGNLLAWCLRHPTGTLGLLQTLPSHMRQGLGSLVVRYLSKEIVALGEEVLSPVVIDNKQSRQLFEKLGFVKIDNIYWTA